MEDIARILGRRIRQRRILLGLSQAQLSTLVGVDQTAVSQWERGLSCPARRHEGRILDALNAHGTGMFELPGGVAA